MKISGLGISVLFSLLCQLGFAQISGQVFEIDFDNKVSPLPGVHVYYTNTEKGTISNLDGKFLIEANDNASALVFSFVGFKNDTLLIKDIVYPLQIILKEGNVLKDFVVEVSESGYHLDRMDARNVIVMNQGELRKAACCNLAESFETNPSVDASYTDAVTGTKQIQMLGLSGKYVQIMQDNLPLIRGLSTIYGFEYVPGSWINSIQVSKGAGSVVNGFESMTGQINISWKKPGNAEKFHVNLFSSQAGRMEANINASYKINKHWETTLLTHGRGQYGKFDMNSDSFLDMPIGQRAIIHKQWNYRSEKFHMEFGIGALNIDTKAGQMIPENPDTTKLYYTVFSNTQRVQGFAKIGYLFPNEHFKSLAFQMSAMHHEHDARFGKTTYRGLQGGFYGNVIFQDELGDKERLTYKTGVSLIYDNYDEKLGASDTLLGQTYAWEEIVPGAYGELSLNDKRLSMVAGARIDYHNIYGLFFTPRLNARFSFSENNALKIAAGSGRRTANLIMENVGLLASSRQWIIKNNPNVPGYGLQQEVAWNFGVGFQQSFKLFYREASVLADAYYTDFKNQIVVDLDASPQEVSFYNLDGKSFSKSFQVELNYDISKRFDLRLAYRFLDVKTDYSIGLLAKPFIASDRAFGNLSWESKKSEKGSQWKADVTATFTGQQRVPSTANNPEAYRRIQVTPTYWTFNSQVTRVFNKQLEMYIGGENLNNFKLQHPIIASDDPFGKYFDSSLIWGPIFGRMVYFGLRFTIP